jgi:hypothetical protein
MKPRIRTIKPEAFTDEDLWDLEEETDMPIFRAFSGLWCHADREGRFEWRPRALKAGILPYWDGDFSRVLDALTTRGFIVKYTSSGREYGCIPTFLRHQVINNREEDSKLPAPPLPPEEPEQLSQLARVEHASGTRQARVAHASCAHTSGTEGKGREGNGRERPASFEASPQQDSPKPPGSQRALALIPTPAVQEPSPEPDPAEATGSDKPKTSRRKPTRAIPADWHPLDRHIAQSAERGVDCSLAADKFRAHAETNDRRCVDWDRAFDSWLLNERPRPGVTRPAQSASGFDPFERVRQLQDAARAAGSH